jgi:hypothetical protein
MVHLTTVVAPAVTPVTVLVGDAGVVTVPGPLWITHAPVPGVAALPARVKLVVLHNVWSPPAAATGAAAVLVNIISSKVGTHPPLLTLQRTVALVPGAIPVTVVVALVVLVIVAVPLCKLHVPTPIAGTVATIVNVLVLHCVMSDPASAVEDG